MEDSINKLVHDVHRLLGGYAPRATYGNLKFNGKYHGMYSVIERIDDRFVETLGGHEDTGELVKSFSHDGKLADTGGFEVTFSADGKMTQLAQFVNVLKSTAVTFDAWERSLRPIVDFHSLFTYMVRTGALCCWRVVSHALPKDCARFLRRGRRLRQKLLLVPRCGQRRAVDNDFLGQYAAANTARR